jgi:hypothetical protein
MALIEIEFPLGSSYFLFKNKNKSETKLVTFLYLF